jgi:hypothetical protein
LESFGQFSEVFVRPEAPALELIIPVSTQIADYASAVGDALRFIANFEGRDELVVYASLIQSDRDVIRIGASEADDDGSIGIDPGVDIVQHARDLLASAACAAIDPRRAYHLGKMQQAEEYMRRVRLGQTEHGSFVVTLLAPIPPALSVSRQIPMWPHIEDEPFERKVTRFLAQALLAAREAVVESNRGDDGWSAFTNAVAQGVSANLCEAVASIAQKANGADVSVTWARTRPAPKPRDHVMFSRSDGDTLNEAARQFRLREPKPDVRVFGFVTDLHCGEDEHEGRITIKSLIEGKLRSITAVLSPEDYRTAIQANERQVGITAFGDLESEGQRWRLLESREIRILEADDEK